MYGQTRSQTWLTGENWTIPVTGNSQQELTTLGWTAVTGPDPVWSRR